MVEHSTKTLASEEKATTITQRLQLALSPVR